MTWALVYSIARILWGMVIGFVGYFTVKWLVGKIPNK